MSRWWRAYDEALDDPKLQRLGLEMIGAWFNLLCMASRCAGIIRIADVPFCLRLSKPKAVEIITRLATAGLIERDGDDYRPHNWTGRQFQSDDSVTRVQRYRERKRNVTVTADETLQEHKRNVTVTADETLQKRPQIQRQNTDTEKERKMPEPSGSGELTRAELERELFRRGRQVCGKSSGGLIASLLKSRQQDVALARSVIELAATKADPREYVAAAVKGEQIGGFGQRPGGSHSGSLLDAIDRLNQRIADGDDFAACANDIRRLPSG